uniref:Uncharacterized protein n=1 Tax=Polytomella parva TaxID=51329 RepID=A0A7S0YCV2_9CHLO|nr:Chain t, NUOP8 [Polytomella sp. Pringsheim 198.80]7ARD_t Chain t, NUOP8 [Polytomella sp. Pringsheim 198.80]|mmetsp:Transcript_18120/g.33110  ORF Transcript_18120/g.33110 Transcript_18120/m.33110 type:complete len:135 (+) Transcript_18120:83-487(+)
MRSALRLANATRLSTFRLTSAPAVRLASPSFFVQKEDEENTRSIHTSNSSFHDEPKHQIPGNALDNWAFLRTYAKPLPDMIHYYYYVYLFGFFFVYKVADFPEYSPRVLVMAALIGSLFYVRRDWVHREFKDSP